MSLPKGAVNRRMTEADAIKMPFLMFQAHPDDYYSMANDSLRGTQQESTLSKEFFHPNNIDLIQRQLISEIFNRSRGEYLIEKQNEQDLIVVMRSIFLQNAKHLPHNIKEQIRELNFLVVDDLVPNMMSEIKGYFGYLERAFGPQQVLDRPENVSNKGLKTLPSVTRTFG